MIDRPTDRLMTQYTQFKKRNGFDSHNPPPHISNNHLMEWNGMNAVQHTSFCCAPKPPKFPTTIH